jgi:hypothetical protein
MKRILIAMLLGAVMLSACGPAPTPQPTVDINATVLAMSGTMVAATLTAAPTSTPPPTNTPLPTDTPTPAATDTPAISPTPKPTATSAATSVPFVGCFIPTGASSQTAPFKLENFTSVTVNITINGTTTNGDHPISCSYDVQPKLPIIFTLWFGTYQYWVQVPGRKIFTGSFYINDSDKATMQVTTKGIKIGPFP